MASTDSLDAACQFEAAPKVPIAHLNPDLSDLGTRVVRGVVAIIWPYNSVKNTSAFILAEPEFRLRRSKGQVRINFDGPSAKAVSQCNLGSSDEVLLSLDGAEWEADESKNGIPGASIGWQLKFSEKLSLQLKSGDSGDSRIINVDHPPQVENETPVPPEPASPVPPAPQPDSQQNLPTLEQYPLRDAANFTPEKRAPIKRLDDGEFESPAFIKRARVSYGSLFEGGFDIFEDDGGVKGRGRKRTRFGRDSGAWRYSSQSPSPSPGPEIAENHDAPSEESAKPSSSPSRQVTDEGIQTMEVDIPASGLPTETLMLHESVDHNVQVPQVNVTASNGNLADQEQPNISSAPWGTGTSVSASHSAFSNTGAFPRIQQEPTPVGSMNLGVASDHFQQDWWQSAERHMVGYEDYSNHEMQSSLHEAPLVSQHVFGPHMHAEPVGRGLNHLDAHGQDMPPAVATSPNENISSEAHTAQPTEYSVHSDLAGHATHYPPRDETEPEAKASMFHQVEHPSDASYPSLHLPLAHEAANSHSNAFISAESDASKQEAESTAHAATAAAWTAVDDSQSVSHPVLPRIDTADGSTPHSAVVIGESESEDETAPPEPVASALPGSHGPSITRNQSASAQSEGEPLAANGDESVGVNSDESESFPDEKSEGDYDTSLRPADDEDDIDDDDLRRRSFEPEFHEGDERESWDEDDYGDDEDGEGHDYDSEYEDIEQEIKEQEKEEQKPPPPNRLNASAPEVIDLISSSEDEDEAEAEEESPEEESPEEESPEEAGGDDDYEAKEDEEKLDDGLISQSQDAPLADGHRVSPEYGPQSESESSDSGSEEASAKGDEEYEDMGSEAEAEAEEVDEEAFEQDVRREASELVSDSSQHRGPETEPEEGLQKPDEKIQHDTLAEQMTSPVKEPVPSVSPRPPPETTTTTSQPVVQVESPKPVDDEGDVTMADTVDLELDEKEEPRDVESHLNLPEELVAHTLPPAANTRRQLRIREAEATDVAPVSPPLTRSFRSQILDEEEHDVVMDDTSPAETRTISADQVPTPLDSQQVGAKTAPEIPEIVEGEDEIVGQNPAESDIELAKLTEEKEVDTAPSKLEPGLPSQVPSSDNHAADVKDTVSSVATQEESGRVSLRADSAESEADSFKSQMEADDALQASLRNQSSSQPEEEHLAMPLQAHENIPREQDVNGSLLHQEASQVSSPILGSTPQKAQGKKKEQLLMGSPVSRRLRRANQESLKEETDQASEADSSIQLARASLGSRKAGRREVTPEVTRPQTRSKNLQESPTPSAVDKSAKLSKTALLSSPRGDTTPLHTSQLDSSLLSKKEEEATSVTESKLQIVRLLRDELKEYTTLKVLRQHVKKTVEVMAVVMMTPANPQRAKGGPREYMMSFTTTDHTIGPNAVAEVQLYRPHKESLPVVKAGDIVLLRNFTVESMKGKGFGLRTNDGSSWAVFERDFEPAQIKGPPVEYGEADQRLAASLREWYALLDEKARQKLEKANQKIIEAGRSK